MLLVHKSQTNYLSPRYLQAKKREKLTNLFFCPSSMVCICGSIGKKTIRNILLQIYLSISTPFACTIVESLIYANFCQHRYSSGAYFSSLAWVMHAFTPPLNLMCDHSQNLLNLAGAAIVLGKLKKSKLLKNHSESRQDTDGSS